MFMDIALGCLALEACLAVQVFRKSVPCYPIQRACCRPGFLAFVWACARGVRGYVVAMAGLSALIAVYETLLFAVLGRVVDWIAAATPATLWAERGNTLTWIAAIMVGSVRWWRCAPASSTRRWPSTCRCACAGTFTA